ncbi:disease resistance protein Roq1 isoform X2 [Capsicum galapagoense]
MASTCLSSTKSWKNDVFLSFRGEDTRKTFVGHLYYALNQKGIHTFKDDVRLERGKSISPELVKAIEQSRFAIVVFSKNYASSTWCLDELGKIMECKKELGLTVIPIFYDVDPSDVSKQSGSFAESFGRHEENLKEDVEKVQCWRDAFRQAGKIAGYDLPNAYDGYESNCIQHVVEDILSKLCQVISTIEKDLVGMESRMHEVSSLLRMETPDVRFIGIWGMSGIDNVSEIQRTRGLQYLQGVLLSKILKVSLTIASVYEGMKIIKQRLRSMKVLIILDDVNQKDQLEMLVGGRDWFGTGSRILITTTDRHLLHNHEVDDVYQVNLMTINEAIELFSLHAFKQRIPEEDFEEVLNQVVQNAGFLPLALKILGSSLYGLNKIEWKCAVDRLKDMPDHVLSKLKISFEGLNPSDQRLFLDIGCFYRGKLRGYVEEMLESCHIGSTIRVLIEKSLLFISPYDTIEMHDLIQEMAWHIVRQGDTRRSRIWLREDIEDLFTGNLEAEAVEGLWIPRNYMPKQDISYYNINESFRRMKRLRVLVVRATNFCSVDPITHIPSSIRWLDWEGCPLNSLPQSFEPSKLLRLDILESTTLQKLWTISKWEKRLPFSVFFPGDIRWNGFTYYRKEQTKRFSTQLDPCWYESKFKGFVICFRVPSVIGQNQKPSDAKSQRGSRRFGCAKVTAKLVQRYNRQEHDVLQKKCLIVARQTCCSHGSKYAICFSYIPFVSLWHSSDCEKGKKLPNDYCFFEASIDPDTATKWGLLLVYENKIQQIDQSTIAVQLDVESRNTDLFRVCNDDQGQKMEDASVKRRRLNFPQVMKDSYSPSECQTFQIIPDQQLEIPSSSATQSFQHREESYASEQPETIADPQVSEAIDDATSCMVLEQLEAPSSSEQPETFEFSPGEHKDNSVTTGSDCSEGFPQLETTCTSGQSQTLLLFPEHS